MRRLRRVLACVAIGVAAATVALLSHSAGWLERLEFVTWDARQRWLATPAPDELPIKLILIDQASLDWANAQAGTPWPWPREFYVPMIEFCQAGGAKAVAFDLFFSEPSMYGVDDDERFAAALADFSATVLAVPPGPATEAPSAWPEHIPPSQFHVLGLDDWHALHPQAELALDAALMSVPEIASSAAALAHVRGDQDGDSIIRRMTPILTFDNHVLPVLGLALHEVALSGSGAQVSELRMDGDSLVVGARQIPLDVEGKAILRFRKSTQRGEQRRMYDSYSAAGVINAQLALESSETPAMESDVFEDAYVIIGVSAAGTYDLKPTPMNKAGPGAEVHATFLDNLMSGTFMRSTDEAWVWLFTIGLSLLGAFAAHESRNSVHVVAAFVCTLPLPWVVGVLAFVQGWWWPIVLPEFSVSGALVGGLIANYATEGRQRRFIKRTFQFYLSPAVIEQIVDDPSRLRLGGERRELTILICDIEGFSSIAEKLDAQALVAMLNEYLTEMTDVILEEEGTLDKYIGDAIVAFWNAPLDQPDHALRAARAASRCQQALAARRQSYLAQRGVDLHMRIGVNTGVASVGNFGSQGRFDYTVIGHAANLASRLEGANRFFGTSTLVAEESWQRLGDQLRGREVGLVRLAGTTEPIRAYELLANGGRHDADCLAAYRHALTLLRTATHGEALAHFERLGDDPVAQRYVEKLRSESASDTPTWDGVWNLTEK